MFAVRVVTQWKLREWWAQRGASRRCGDELFNLRGEDECGACLVAELGQAYAAYVNDHAGVDEFPGAGVVEAGPWLRFFARVTFSASRACTRNEDAAAIFLLRSRCLP